MAAEGSKAAKCTGMVATRDWHRRQRAWAKRQPGEWGSEWLLRDISKASVFSD